MQPYAWLETTGNVSARNIAPSATAFDGVWALDTLGGTGDGSLPAEVGNRLAVPLKPPIVIDVER